MALKVRYRALSTSVISDRVIEPGQLHWDPSLETLYLIAWCQLREDVRVFALHRFVAAVALTDTCPARAELRSKAAFKNAFRVWRGKNVEAVRIWFSAEVAQEIRERRWLPEQTVEDASGGAIVLSGAVAGDAELMRWVLGYGAAARVLEPLALADAVAAALREGARGYEPRPKVGLSRASGDR